MGYSGQATGRKPSFLDDYVTVHARIERFYGRYVNGRIVTELVSVGGEGQALVCFKAYGYRNADSADPDATGHAIDKLDLQNSTFEKTETAAVGRMLVNMGFETKERAENGPGSAQERTQGQAAATGQPTQWNEDKWLAGDAVRKEICDVENETDSRAQKGIHTLRQFVREKLNVAGPYECKATDLNMYKSWMRSLK